MPSSPRIIGHLDMDAFFAAIEERDNPRWRGLPIAIGADPEHGTGRGVVSTANYAARRYGIYSATPIKKAWQLAQAAEQQGEPATIFVSGSSFGRYRAVSKKIMYLLEEEVGTVYQRSVDEAYFDLSHLGSFSAARLLSRKIKKRIHEQENLTASIGIGPNKLVAKIASDFEKPDGLTVIESEQVVAFLAPLHVRAIPGVGPKAEAILRRAGITTIKDAQQLSEAELKNMLGQAWGGSLFRKVRGIDESPLRERVVAKSISEQRTFHTDTKDPKAVIAKVVQLADEVAERVTNEGFQGFRTVTIIVRYADFTTVTRARSEKEPLTGSKSLQQAALRLLLPFFDARENPGKKSFRLVGVRVSSLS